MLTPTNLVIPLVAIIGLIVLVALHDVDSSVAVPVIVGLAGVHLGANIGSDTPVPPASKPPVV